MVDLTPGERETIRVALESYAEWLTKQRTQAARDRRRLIRWSESPRMGEASREGYVTQAADLARYIDARDARIEQVREIAGRFTSEAVAA